MTGSADFTAIAWSFETGEPLQTFSEHTGAITCMVVDKTGKILLTGATDSTVRSWDLRSGESLKVFEGHKSSIVCMTVRAFSIVGRLPCVLCCLVTLLFLQFVFICVVITSPLLMMMMIDHNVIRIFLLSASYNQGTL